MLLLFLLLVAIYLVGSWSILVGKPYRPRWVEIFFAPGLVIIMLGMAAYALMYAMFTSPLD